VPQDPTDEPASVLLERIREERTSVHRQQASTAPPQLPLARLDRYGKQS